MRRVLSTSAMAPLLCLPLAAAACGDGGSGWAGSVADSAGVEIITSRSGLWEAADAWAVEQDLMIGTAEGAPELQFGQVSGIDVGPDGRIYVIDQQASEVRVFSPDGELVTAMGRAGAGPGELSQAAGPVFVAGDTIVVPDVLQQRITLFMADGESAGSHSMPMTGGIAVKWMKAPDRTLVQQAMVMAFPNQPTVEPKNLLLRRTPTGAVLDTLLELPIGESIDLAGSSPQITLFESEPMWTVGPEGRLYTGINSRYDIRVHDPSGELVRIIRKPFERRPITDSDRAEFRRVITGLWREAGMQPEALEVMSQALGFADAYPAYANLVGGPHGTLWVQRIQTPDEIRDLGGTFDIQDMGSATWEVFGTDGRLLGAVRMPPRFTPMLFVSDRIYGLLRDELDVQYVARLNIVRGATPGE